MNIVLIALAVVGYFTIATAAKVYFKLNRWDRVLPEEPYVIGLFWPIYLVYRVVWGLLQIAFKPFELVSQAVETKVVEMQEAKKRVRVKESRPSYDPDYQDALQEVEESLKDKYHRMM